MGRRGALERGKPPAHEEVMKVTLDIPHGFTSVMVKLSMLGPVHSDVSHPTWFSATWTLHDGQLCLHSLDSLHIAPLDAAELARVIVEENA